MQSPDDALIEQGLAAARDTRRLLMGHSVVKDAAALFASQFGAQIAVMIADPNTFAAAGRDVVDSFKAVNHPMREPFIFTDPQLYAEQRFVSALHEFLEKHDAIPVAVGSGTINDLTKYAAHRLSRPYLCVATAASMDGYTAYGASITIDGSKQTVDCPAPRAVLADLDVIAQAPRQMNAWGYADLLAKITAGADWIIADELGVEPIAPIAWKFVQDRLRDWTGNPKGIQRGEPDAIRSLVCGLMMCGFAMQAITNSRPASGAEHQFSHLWDMQHATTASHGAKVGVATCAVARLYESLLRQPFDQIHIDQLVSRWESIESIDKRIDRLFRDTPAIAERSKIEMRGKYSNPDQLHAQLTRLKQRWPELKQRLAKQMPSATQIAQMLDSAGAPYRPEQIGITPTKLRHDVNRAYHIRRRFTSLDLLARTGLLEPIAAQLEVPNVDA